MTQLPSVSGKDVLRALEKGGCKLSHVRGSHHVLKCPEDRLVVVPVHGNRDLPKGTLRSILKQAGLTMADFLELL